MTILGISVGTTRTGVCVLKDGVLQDRRVHDYKTMWSDGKLHAILKDYRHYILKHNVTAIILKIPPLNNHTPAVRRLLRRLEALAREYSIMFDLITKTELKSFTGARSTDELIDYTRRLYPELNVLYDKGISNHHNYNKKLFEAVLSAHVFQEKQRIRALQIERATQ